MQPRTRLGRFLAYSLLLVGSLAFAFPLFWMIGTSLKPLEQSNTTPPHWIPYDYRAELNGRWQPVVRGAELTTPMLVVRLEEGPQARTQQVVAPEDFTPSDTDPGRGRIRVEVAGATHWTAATVLRRAEAGWFRITQRRPAPVDDVPLNWDVLPPDKIEAHPRLFWSNYPDAIRKMGMIEVWVPLFGMRTIPIFWIYLRNTLIVSALGVVGTLASCSLAAYSLAKIPWRGRGVLFAITLATMMVPFPVLMVPLYSLFKSFGWIGTLLPLWVPAFFGSGFNIFLLRQFFLTIPRELSEAARLDGASELGILWRIILPLSKPGLAVVALFHFLYAWNDFMGPLLFLTRRETFTLSLGLQTYQSQHGGADWTSLMAASTLICLPIILLFFFTQRTFLRGISTTGMR